MRDLPQPNAPGASEHEAFNLLYQHHARSVLAYCLSRSHTRDSAEEACSIVFLEAWRRRAEVDLRGRPAAPWLLGVARNVLCNQRRSQRRGELAVSRLRRIEPTHSEDVSARVERRQLVDDMLVRLRELPPAQRTVVCLCGLHDSSYEATAAALEIPIGTVRSRLSRARDHLALALGAEEREFTGATAGIDVPIQTKEQ